MLLYLISFDCRSDQAHLVTIVVPGFQFLTHLHPISRGIWDLGYQAPSSTRQGRKEIQVFDHRHGWKEHIVLGTKTHGLSDLCQIFGDLEVKDRNASFASHEVTSWCENAGKTPRRQPLVGAVRPQMADIVVDLPRNTAPGTAWNSMEHGPMWDDVGCQVTCSIVPQQCKDFAREPGAMDAMDAMGEMDSSHDLIWAQLHDQIHSIHSTDLFRVDALEVNAQVLRVRDYPNLIESACWCSYCHLDPLAGNAGQILPASLHKTTFCNVYLPAKAAPNPARLHPPSRNFLRGFVPYLCGPPWLHPHGHPAMPCPPRSPRPRTCSINELRPWIDRVSSTDLRPRSSKNRVMLMAADGSWWLYLLERLQQLERPLLLGMVAIGMASVPWWTLLFSPSTSTEKPRGPGSSICRRLTWGWWPHSNKYTAFSMIDPTIIPTPLNACRSDQSLHIRARRGMHGVHPGCLLLPLHLWISLSPSLSAKLKASEKQPLHQGRQDYIQYIFYM